MKKLSTKMSTGIGQALRDAEKIIALEKYAWSPNRWHLPLNHHSDPLKHKCEVCLAGCSMAERYGILWEENATPGILKNKDRMMLSALDSFMRQDFYNLFDLWGTSTVTNYPKEMQDRVINRLHSEVPHFSMWNFQKFKVHARKAIKILREEGL